MKELITQLIIDQIEAGRVPDALVRFGIRRLCAQRLRIESTGDCEQDEQRLHDFVEMMSRSSVAPLPEKANEQHYELPPTFFELALGPRRKYSSCLFPEGIESLGDAEIHALEATCEHAQLADGQDILELGCGWGALTLWMAQRYPSARITAVSNSSPQRRHIEAEARQKNLTNIRVITADMNTFEPSSHFDRIVSVEMFEHMRNYELLLRRISNWLRADGRLFIHIFCHRKYAYPFEPKGASTWMGKYFFTGGIMPSDDLLYRFSRDMQVTRKWRWSGRHYEKTANAWLSNLDDNRKKAMQILTEAYGHDEAGKWFRRWRLFFMACAELWGYRNGNEWWVSHYLLEPVHETSGGDQIAQHQNEPKTAGAV